MKKFLYTVLTIIIFIYVSVNIFQFYNAHYLLDSEAVVNIYPNLPDEKVDKFFLLPEGTFDPKKHTIIYSFVKSDAYLLDYYYNLPIYNYSSLENLDCKEEFSKEKHYRFNRNEIVDDGILYVRLSTDKSGGFNKAKDSKSTIAIRMLAVSFTFGKINSIIVNSDGAIRYCD